MTTLRKFRYLLGALVIVGLALTFIPPTAGATNDPLIDQMTSFVYDEQRQADVMDKFAYKPLIHQLLILRMRREEGNQKSLSRAMGHFLDMLMVDGKFGHGISKRSAKAIFDFCIQIAPPMNPVPPKEYREAFGIL